MPILKETRGLITAVMSRAVTRAGKLRAADDWSGVGDQRTGRGKADLEGKISPEGGQSRQGLE